MQKIVILALMLSAIMCHKCIHDQIVNKVQVDEIPVSSNRMMTEDGVFRPLEIKVIWGSTEGATEAEKEYTVKTLIPYSVKYITKVLNVNSRKQLDLTHLKKRIDILRSKGIRYVPKCNDYIIPMDIIEKPIDQDYVLFVSVGQDPKNANILAYATHCMKDMNHNGRPVMGYSFFNTDTSYKMNMDNFQGNVQTVIHELLHAFGFSKDMFSSFLDENGKPRGKEVIKRVVRRGKETNILNLPRLTEFAKEYFDCDRIDGVEMENQEIAGPFSLGSHFEARMVGEDLMTSYGILNLQFTEFLAIMLEETGWYRVNRKMVGKSITGYKAGCDFVFGKCVKSYDNKRMKAEVLNEDDFCTDITKQNICNVDFTHQAYCGAYRIEKSNIINPAFDYFNGLVMAGKDTDNCPMRQPFIFSSTNCRNEEMSQTTSYYPQIGGNDSRCVSGNYYWSGYSRSEGIRCVKAKCLDDGKAVSLELGNGIVAQCNKGQESVDVTGLRGNNARTITGSIKCPNVERMCLSLQMQYFEDPNRFPYEDVTEASTISDDLTGESVYKIRQQKEARSGKKVFDTDKLAAGFADIVSSFYGTSTGKLTSDAFVAIRSGVFITGNTGSDDDLVENTMDVYKSQWQLRDSSIRYLKGKLRTLIRNTPRIAIKNDTEDEDEKDTTDGDKPADKPEPQDNPKKSKAEVIMKVSQIVIDSAQRSGFPTTNQYSWVADNIRSMCNIAIRRVDLDADEKTLVDSFIMAYKQTWQAGWARSYQTRFVGYFRQAIQSI